MTDLPALPFEDRREYALARLPDGSLLLPASALRFKNGDSEYRYRPDSELYYLTGWEAPECVALLRGFPGESRFILFVAEPNPEAELWAGPRLRLEEVKELYGADDVYALSQLEERCDRLLRGGDRIYYRLGADERCDRVVRAALATGRGRRPRHGVGPHVLADPGAILDGMRVVKDVGEIARMRQAAEVTVSAFRRGIGTVTAGVGEWEVESVLESEFRRRGGNGPAFTTIVGAGVNGCTLHYVDNAARIGDEDLVLMDAGAEFGYYAADITRTVPASGAFEGAGLAVYETVLRAQRLALSACKSGVSLEDVHEVTVRNLVEGLVDLGALTGSVEDALEQGSFRTFYPHQTSHWLGLDTHDVGPYRTVDGAAPLAEGMAFTVEPGLYFRPGSCPAASMLEGIGVRIEDDVLITAEGADVLTGALPTAAKEVEQLVSGSP